MKEESVDFDEFCDHEKPRKIKYEDILKASQRISGSVVRTPCIRARMAKKCGIDIYLKQEFLQFTGCFKERGVRNTLMLLSEEQRKGGVIAATTGNHGIALSYHCSLIQIPCVVVMPNNAPMSKYTKCHSFGATVIMHGADLQQAKMHAMHLGKVKRMAYINGFDHPNVIEGQGSIGIEIIEQLPDVDAILVPVGGGSLLSGVAMVVHHLKPNTKILGIETDKTCSMTAALMKNERISLDIGTTIADGLAVNKVGVNTFFCVKGMVHEMVTVQEDWVARAVLHLIEEENIVVEGGAAVGIAAILAGLLPDFKSKKVVCILTGGNIDSTALTQVIERGLTTEGRLAKFSVTVPAQSQGVLGTVRAMLAGIGVFIRDCTPEQALIKDDVISVKLRIVAETRGWCHTKELVELVKKHFKKHCFDEISE